MNGDLLRLIDGFGDLRILVIGEAMLDSYLDGYVERLCREAPVPIVTITGEKLAPGGAANTAANVASLGGQVTFLSIVGEDEEGEQLRQALAHRGVPTHHLLTFPTRHTLVKRRVIGSSQMLLRIDQGSIEGLNGEAEEVLIETLREGYGHHDAVVVSDYGYGILTPRVLATLADCQIRTPRPLIVDAKDLMLYRDVGVTAVKPNYKEALMLVGLDPVEERDGRAERIIAHRDRFLEVTGAEIVAVTLDRDGALIFERGNPPYRTYADPQPHSHAAGAGDTFASSFALALAAGAYTHTAAELASAAAAVVVERDGTTTCSAGELRGYLTGLEKHVTDVDLLSARVTFYRRHEQRIVFTNGCFDILHRGHITYLNRAKEQGDILIVGVNSDASVKRLKGPSRPINSLEDRVQVLAALSCIDHIIPFEEDTPSNLIRAIRPDVFVKGGDYTRETLPEAPLVEELGGWVEILPYVDDHSTTLIIDRIRQAYAQPADACLDG